MVTDYRDENDMFMSRLKLYMKTGLWDHVINDLAFNFDGEDIPEVRRLLTDNKHHVIKAMLELVKELSKQEGYDDLDYVMSNLMPVLDDIGLDWPEIRVIRNSVWKESRERMLREPNDELDEAAKVSNMLSKRWTKIADRGIDNTRQSGDISHIRYMCDALLSSGAPVSTVDEILRMNIDVVAHALQHDLERGAVDNAIWATSFIKDRFPGAYKMIIPMMNGASDVIAKRIEKMLNLDNLYEAAGLISRMIKAGMDPETIRSLKSKVGPKMLESIKKIVASHGFNHSVIDGLESMEQIGYKTTLGTGKIRQRLVDDFREALVNAGLTQGGYYYGQARMDPNSLIKVAIKYGGHDTINMLKDVIEDEKSTVLKQILSLFRTNSVYSIYPAVTTLRHFGFKWPELDIIEKSLKNLGELREDDEPGIDDYGRVWRDTLEFNEHLQTLLYDLRKPENWEMLALTLEDMGYLNIEQVLPPRAKKLIEDNKANVIRSILANIKEMQKPKRMLKAVLALNNMGVNWPELDMIYKSLHSDSLREDGAPLTVHYAVERARDELQNQVLDGNYWTIGRVISDLKREGLSHSNIRAILDDYKDNILARENSLLQDANIAVHAGLANMVDLRSIGIEWPELNDILEHNKEWIMKSVLHEVAYQYNKTMYEGKPPVMYGHLRTIGVNWPELDIIKRSVEASNM